MYWGDKIVYKGIVFDIMGDFDPPPKNDDGCGVFKSVLIEIGGFDVFPILSDEDHDELYSMALDAADNYWSKQLKKPKSSQKPKIKQAENL
jgi:hypothetical protein